MRIVLLLGARGRSDLLLFLRVGPHPARAILLQCIFCGCCSAPTSDQLQQCQRRPKLRRQVESGRERREPVDGARLLDSPSRLSLAVQGGPQRPVRFLGRRQRVCQVRLGDYQLGRLLATNEFSIRRGGRHG